MKLARIFQDGMVLQRHMPICIWGTCEEPQTVAVRLNGKLLCRRELSEGPFQFTLPPQEAMEDALLEIGTVSLGHVNIGEVWVAGGQSNMEFMLQYDQCGEAVIRDADDDHLRTYIVGQYSFPGERELGYKAWNPWDRWLTFCPDNARELPAVAVYFALELRRQGVPVGIVSCNWGGTTASAWMDRQLLENDPDLRVYTDEFAELTAKLDLPRFQAIRSVVHPAMAAPQSQKVMSVILKNTFHPAELQKNMAAAISSGSTAAPPSHPGSIDASSLSRAELMQEGPGDKSEPGSLYNNMVQEILGYSVKGVIWYQGESDEQKAPLYSRLFSAMVRCWQQGWLHRNPAQADLPFLFAQIAPFGVWMGNSSENYPELRRQQQLAADTLPGLYMASTSDVGNVYDIHPKEKQPVGFRLALLARKYIYGEDIHADAPRALEAVRREDTVTIPFRFGQGLHIREQDFSAYNGFPALEIPSELLPPVTGGICGLEILADGVPVSNVRCRAVDSALILQGDSLRNVEKLSVRLAQTPFYRVNLCNDAGIPAVPFVIDLP